MINRLKLVVLTLFLFSTQILADTNTTDPVEAEAPLDVVDKRSSLEQKYSENPFFIMPYRMNYLLPAYYNSRSINAMGHNSGRQTKQVEVKFQFSLKIPLFELPRGQLYAAYTQQSYWQAYTDSAFFRESNYEPELFWEIPVDQALFSNWQLKLINVGLNHQSNGRGGEHERSWNRVYISAILANEQWKLKIQPWIIVQDSALKRHNPDIKRFKGHGEVELAYKINGMILAVKAQNLIESQFKRGAVQLSMTFPLNNSISAYVQLFSGYGQNLIEYNQYTNAVGIGVSLTDLI